MSASMRTLVLLVAGAILLAPTGAAQMLWGDNFENFGIVGSPSGPYLPGPVPTFPTGAVAVDGGWNTWYLNPAARGGITTAFAYSPPTAIEIGGLGVGGSGCDVVQEHSSSTSLPGNPGFYDHAAHGPAAWPGHTPGSPTLGTWEYRAWNYCPNSFPTGTASHYFIVNDVLNNATSGPTRWIVQVRFNHVTGQVIDEMRSAAGGVAIIYNTWVELVVTIDLDYQCVAVTYNGYVIGNGTLFPSGWTTPGVPQIANVDLYTAGATSYWDDVTLTRIIDGPQYQVNNAAAAANVNGKIGTGCGVAETRVTPGTTVSVNITVATAAGHEAVIDVGVPYPLGSPGALFLSPGKILNIDIFSPTRLFLYGGSMPVLVPHPGGTTTLSFLAPPLSGLNLSLQYFVLNPLSLDGYELTQPCNLRIL